jgi:hypothetical protein
VTLTLPDREFTATLIESPSVESSTFNIPLDGAGHIHLAVPFSRGQSPPIIGPLATSLRTVLAPQLHQLKSQHPPAVQAVAASE